MSATEYDVAQEAEAIRRKRLEGLGLADQYDLWRESLPNARSITSAEAFNLFLEAQNVENAALDGRVSVSTGGTDDGPATPTPIPGTDAEGPGTDAPGDTSELPVGGTPVRETDVDPETGEVTLSDLILKGEGVPTKPEGLWEPPPEAEALNYEPPSTDTMTYSKEWIEEAKKFHKYMGSPDLIPGGPSPALVEDRAEYVRRYREQRGEYEPGWFAPTGRQSRDNEIGQWARRQFGSFNWNLAAMLSLGHKVMTSGDPEFALNFLNLLNMYDHSDGGAAEFGMAVLNLASDPTTYSGLGVGTLAARGAAKQLAKAQLKKSTQLAIIGGTAGMVEGASLAGGFNLTVQAIEKQAGAREGIDWGEAGLATGAGGLLGIAIGGGAGHLVGRRMDKVAKEAEKMLADALGGRLVSEERAAEGRAADQIAIALEDQIAKEAAQGRRATDAEMILEFINEGHEIPRKVDGSIDQDILADRIRIFHDKGIGATPQAKIIDNAPEAGQVDIEYDVLANDDVTDSIYKFFDEMVDLFKKDVDLFVTFEQDKAVIKMRPKKGFKDEYGTDATIAEMIHEEWELREYPSIPAADAPPSILPTRKAGSAETEILDFVDKWNRERAGTEPNAPFSDKEIQVVEGGVDINTWQYGFDTGPAAVEVFKRIGAETGATVKFDVNAPGPIKVRGTAEQIRRFLEIEDALPEQLIGGAEITHEGNSSTWTFSAGKVGAAIEDSFAAERQIKELAAENNINVEVVRGTKERDFPIPAETLTLQFSNEVDRVRFNKIYETEIGAEKPFEQIIKDVATDHPERLVPAEGETILPGRRGGKPFTVEEGLARGLSDEDIAKLEIDPINVVDKLERAGFKVAMGEEGDILFDATDMSPATAERIERVAKETGVKAEPTALPDEVPSREDGGENLGITYLDDPSLTPAQKELGRIWDMDEPDMTRALRSWVAKYPGELVVKGEAGEVYRGKDLQAADKAWREASRRGEFPSTSHTEHRGTFNPSGVDTPSATGVIVISGDPVDIGRFGAMMADEVQPARLPMAESKELARRIAEIEATVKEEVVGKSASLPGSFVRDATGAEFEVVGRTKNGWYHLRNKLTGEEVNRRRNQFEVLESRPKPEMAGPMELAPFSTNAAKIIAMNEDVVSGKLQGVKITTEEQLTIVKELREMGIKIEQKKLATYWTPAELLYLRDTYNSMAHGMLELGRVLRRDLKNNGRLTDEQMAMFNEAHTTFVATRDLFFATVGNAGRQLQILKTRPTNEVYEFSQGLMDAISISGGRTNTERAITMFADLADKDIIKPGRTKIGEATKISDNIWGNQVASAFLIVRYNMMLSSWRTHFFNFLGNSASGSYQHLLVNPVKMIINNSMHASQIAMGVIDPRFIPDPADRITFHQQWAGLRSHYASARDSLALAKEIALGRDIGEGKVWNELGLRYNVIDVPDGAFAKIGTTPVRLLEAGDAFFKNQYYMSKIHELSSMKARVDEVHHGMDFQTRYRKYVDDPEAPMMREAKEYAAKQTYTNDPSVYGGVFAALARGAAAAQNRSIIVNMIVPFVRTPANLLSYSMEMIGVNQFVSLPTTYRQIMKGSAQESQEAIARLTVAAGLWLTVYEMYQNGDITGTGPSNWEERKAWEAGGWQANSIRIHGKYYDISRADPGGQSLVSIASVFDYYAMTQQQNKPAMEWLTAGLLYTADMIVDESYLSTASDVITAIQSKEEARARSVTASLINSIVVPNLARDIRAVTDPEVRTAASTNLIDQVVKQMKNASPWHSDELPSARDWKGDTIDRYGNAYVRGLVPFKIRDPEDSDPASMAIAYARIPPNIPNKTIEWPKGRGNAINLFAMDGGAGFVYDKYLEIVGKARYRAVNTLMKTQAWKRLVEKGNIGPGSDGEDALRRVLGIGSANGRDQMLAWLIRHSGDKAQFRRGNGDLILIDHPVSVREYIRLRRAVRGTDVPLDIEEFPQYEIEHRKEGPEFFKPRTEE